MNMQQKLQALLDKQDITEVIHLHARSLDRMDGELMKSTYWEEAIEEHQDPIFPELFFYNGNAHQFVDPAMQGFKALKVTQHRISNILIDVKEDKATAESYVWAYHVHEENGVEKEGILGGRHFYQFERRSGKWKIIHRLTAFDWNQNQNASALWSCEFQEKYLGQRNPKDPSYAYI